MNVVIFKDLTTNDYLEQLELSSKEYEGLYVDMDDKDQRKFVKDKASLIAELLKKIERARIDKSKDFKAQVENEASEIKERLESANKPFSALITAHKEKRAKILSEQKAREEAAMLAIQIEEDHSDAITLDKIRTFEIQDAIRLQQERDDEIARQAAMAAEKQAELAEERADQAEKDRILSEAKAKRDAAEYEARAKALAEQAEIRAEQAAEQARLVEIKRQADEKVAQEEAQRKLEANKIHVGSIRKQIKIGIMSAGNIDEAAAKKIVLALCKMNLVTINY